MTVSPNTSTKLSASAKKKTALLYVGIVRSRFNEALTLRLLETARRELHARGIADARITVIEVPGAVEIPWALQLLAEEGRYDFLVALGAVIRGKTAHFDYVVKIATEGIGRVTLDYRIPVGFGVLTLFDVSQAQERIGIAQSAARAGLELALIKKERADFSAPARTIHGMIVRGEGRASKLGFPTINIAYDESSPLPPNGVYAGVLYYNGRQYPGAISLGPDGKSSRPKLEIHCFKTIPLKENTKDASCVFHSRVNDFLPCNATDMKKKIADDVKKAKRFFQVGIL
jgi:6,7-dimethyl-8-ribityllumazine synthase